MSNLKSGTTGELIAEHYFQSIGWVMTRTQPETRTIYKHGKPFIIQLPSTGVPDYTGYEVAILSGSEVPVYRACEVKESVENKMPCSRLGSNRPPTRGKGASQNWWFSQHDKRVAFVCIVWMSGIISTEIFKWKPTGSYKRGEGVTCRTSIRLY